MKNTLRFVAVVAGVSVLSACGGGGGSGSTPPAATSITVAGTAVKGAALVNAAVSVKCASGNASATTSASGAYSVTLSGGSLPCAVRVTGGSGEVFHSVLAGTGATGTFTVNVTPLTEMIVARLAGSSPGTFFDAFGSSSTISGAALAQSIAYVKTAVASVTDLANINPVTDALAVGDAQDVKIDAVTAALAAAGVSLQSVTAAIAANPSAPTIVAGSLAPAASDCPWLKSGRFRVLGVGDADASAVAVIDATTRSGIDPDGAPFTASFDGNCQYTIDEPDWTTRLLVSSSGAILVYGQSKTTSERNVEIAVPEQTLPLAELAGTWNAASWEPSDNIATPGFFATMYEVEFDAGGQLTALSACVGLAACVPEAGPFSRFVVNPTNGGFDEILPNGTTWSRAFLFKTLAGRTALFLVTPELQFVVATRKESIALPAIGTVTNFRQVQLNGNGLIDPPIEDGITVNSVNTTARTATRTRTSDGRVDTLAYDTPRDGLRHRAPNSCTTTAGAPVNCAEVVNMQLQGMGMRVATSVGSTPASAFFNIQANKPAP